MSVVASFVRALPWLAVVRAAPAHAQQVEDWGQPAPKPQESTAIPPEPAPELDVYGQAMFDLGYDFGSVGDPAWQDVVRPTKLPAVPDQFGKGGRTFASARQSRFGVRSDISTEHGDIRTVFEFDLFGVASEAGQTTFHLRHAYGEWRGLRAGQTWSPFMDPDVFPDSVEYWGPSGMVLFRNVQLAFTFFRGRNSDVTLAVERPGWSADSTTQGDRIDLPGVAPRFPAPDLSADVKLGTSWGYVRAAGIVRELRWDDLVPSPVVEGHAWGWGVNLSSNIKLSPATFKLQAVFGRGIESYLDDAAFDVAAKLDPSPTSQALVGVALPVLGLVGFVDLRWSDYLSSTAGYSFVWVDNSSAQSPDAFHIGHYALVNLLVHPVRQLALGPELQFGRRSNRADGFSANDYRAQFSIKYSFDTNVLGR